MAPTSTFREAIDFVNSSEVQEFYPLSNKYYEGEETTPEEDARFIELFDIISKKNDEVQAFGVSMLLVYCAKDYDRIKNAQRVSSKS